MNRMLLTLQRSADQEAALQDLLVQQQTTSSPNFHKWLTPDEFGRQFGPADADIQAVTSWLASFGFQSIQVSRGRTTIEFSGTAAQVEAALHTPIHRYVVNGESHWANANDPQLPAALAPVVRGIVSLHNFPKKPASAVSPRKATLARTQEGKPQVTFTDGSHGIAPADFNKIYNIASTMTGSGVTIGVVARSNINAQDVANFRSIFGLPANNLNIVIDGPDPGNFNPGGGEEAEAVLDATWPGAVAPSATVDLVVSESTNAVSGEDLSEVYIINNNLADIMTESFSGCESQVSSALASFYSGAAEQAAAQGITYLVASGDGGPDSCDNQATVPTTDAPASVNVLASTPFTIAVGGTEFHDCDTLPGCIDTAGTYWQSTNGTNHESARGYIPENVWNESCTALGTNCTAVGLWSSGGGQSIFFPIPFWQAGVTGIPSSGGRAVPDVAVSAADHDGYVLCLDASCAGSSPGFAILSGTSASVQAFGGIMALVDQSKGRQGQADVILYKLAASETFANCNGSSTTAPPNLATCIFNDVTSGNTNIPGETGFPATTGYDEATGLGSVNVTNLLANWSNAITRASTTTLQINTGTAPFTFSYGQPVSVTVAVSPSSGSGTPTGDVSLIASSSTNQGVDGNTLGASGTAGSVTWSTPFLPGGTYNLIAHYAGDGTFLGSSSAPPVSIKVNPTTSLTRLVLVTANSNCGTSMSVPYGSGYVLAVAVVDSAAAMNQTLGSVCAPTPTGAAPTGTVHVTDNGTSLDGIPAGSGNFSLNTGGFFEDQTIQLSVGTHNLQATYAGDNSFNASSSNAPTMTVTKATTTSAITSSPASVASNQTFSVTVVVDTLFSTNPALGSTGVAPTGMVTFTATTAAALPVTRPKPWPNPFLLVEVFAALGCLSLLLVMKRRRSVVLLATTVVLVIALGTSCGSSNNNSNSNTTTTTLGTAALNSITDANGFAAATATLNTAMMTKSGTITAAYSGDGNYNTSTSAAASIAVH